MPGSMKLWPNRIGGSALARNTLWTLLGQGSRLLIQGACFILIARSLGASNYGAFVGAVSLVAIVAPFATWGFGNLIVQNVAREPASFNEWWGNGLLMSLVSGAVLLGAVAGAAHVVMPASISTGLILLVAASDLLAARVADLACLAFQSMEQMGWTANINIAVSALRLLGAAIAVAIWGHPTASQWGLFYCAASCASAAVSVALVTWRLGKPKVQLASMVSSLTEGFHFATGLSAQTIYNDLDKTMLSRLSTLDATGIYAAAYRFIDVAFLPVRSLLWSASPRFFRAGEDGLPATLEYMKRLLPKAIAYAVLIFLVLDLSAPLLPRVLGPEYARSVEALRWLALIPVIRTIHTFYSDALSGAGYQKVRMILQVFVALANFAINLWVIPAYSWRGAVWSSLASDFLLLTLVVSATKVLSREAHCKSAVRSYALQPPLD
jgi:O-antigen/teichoic acid export membrane protein